MRASSLAAVLLLAGCARAAAGPAATGAGDAASKATEAFRAYTARVLKVPASEVHGGPADHSLGDHTRGRARHYEMWPGHNTTSSIRGWATPDGTVITPEQNLGVLFAEAGVWAKPSKKRLDELAYLLSEDIIWAYGSQGKDVTTAMLVDGVEPAEFKLAPDGSGTFRFFHNNHGGALVVGGGGGAPPDVYWENIAVLTADHKATLTRRELHDTR